MKKYLLVSLAIVCMMSLGGCSQPTTPQSTNFDSSSEPNKDLVQKPSSTAERKKEWFLPTSQTCQNFEGEVKPNGCSANWDNAKKICASNQMRLPSYEDFRNVMLQCGGDPDQVLASKDKSETAMKYRDCINKVFESRIGHWYWTSTLSGVKDKAKTVFPMFRSTDAWASHAEAFRLVVCTNAPIESKSTSAQSNTAMKEKLLRAKDDSVVIPFYEVVNDFELLLNIAAHHPEKSLFSNSTGHRTLFKRAIASNQRSSDNPFEKKRIEQDIEVKMQEALKREKSIPRLALPIIEVDTFFTINGRSYENGCYVSTTIFDEESQKITGMSGTGRQWEYKNRLKQVEYAGLTIQSQRMSTTLNGKASFCLDQKSAEELYLKATKYNGKHDSWAEKVLPGKAYYQITKIDNNLANFSDTRTSVEAQLIAFKIFDKDKKTTLVKGNQTYHSVGMTESATLKTNPILFQY